MAGLYPSDFVHKAGGVLVSQERRYCPACDEYYFDERYLMPDGEIILIDGHFGDLYIEKIEKG